MNRLKNLWQGLRGSPREAEDDLDTSLPSMDIRRQWWAGPAGGVLEGPEGVIKYWRHGVEAGPEIQAACRPYAEGLRQVPIVRWEEQGKLLVALQPKCGVALPDHAVVMAPFQVQDSDNRVELVTEIMDLLVALEASGGLPSHFVAWQLWQNDAGTWMLDAVGAPQPSSRLRRALDRRGVDALHLVPWPAPPDILTARGQTAATAVWCLGHLVFELLGGQPPFGHADPTLSSMAMLLEVAPSLRSINPSVSRSRDRLVRRMLTRDPGMRPASMAEGAAEFART